MSRTVPVLGICAYGSNAGKTTLMLDLIPLLSERGIRISVIKHSHHNFEIDHPGKDSYRLREAGAVQMMLGSSRRWALMTEIHESAPAMQEKSLSGLLTHLDASLSDLVLVEGFRQEAIPKIEVHRPALDMPLLAPGDPLVIAVASDQPVRCGVPVLDLNQPLDVADFIAAWLQQQPADPS